jgi:hypothetical protein
MPGDNQLENVSTPGFERGHPRCHRASRSCHHQRQGWSTVPVGDLAFNRRRYPDLAMPARDRQPSIAGTRVTCDDQEQQCDAERDEEPPHGVLPRTCPTLSRSIPVYAVIARNLVCFEADMRRACRPPAEIDCKLPTVPAGLEPAGLSGSYRQATMIWDSSWTSCLMSLMSPVPTPPKTRVAPLEKLTVTLDPSSETPPSVSTSRSRISRFSSPF